MLSCLRRGAGWPPVAPPTTAEVLLRADALVSAVGAVVMASRQELSLDGLRALANGLVIPTHCLKICIDCQYETGTTKRSARSVRT